MRLIMLKGNHWLMDSVWLLRKCTFWVFNWFQWPLLCCLLVKLPLQRSPVPLPEMMLWLDMNNMRQRSRKGWNKSFLGLEMEQNGQKVLKCWLGQIWTICDNVLTYSSIIRCKPQTELKSGKLRKQTKPVQRRLLGLGWWSAPVFWNPKTWNIKVVFFKTWMSSTRGDNYFRPEVAKYTHKMRKKFIIQTTKKRPNRIIQTTTKKRPYLIIQKTKKATLS